MTTPPPQITPPPKLTPPAKPSFRLAPWALVALLLGLAVVLIRRYNAMGENIPYELGGMVGAAIALVLFPSLFAIFGFYAARRSNRVANIAFVTILSLAVLGQLAIGGNRAGDRAFREAVDANKERARQAQKEFDEKGYVEDAQAKIDATSRSLDEASAKLSGDDAAITKAGAEFTRRLGTIAASHNENLKRLIQGGGFEAAGMKSAADIESRLAAVKDLRASNDAMIKFFQDAPNEFEAIMKASGVSDKARPSASRGFLKGVQQTLQLRIRDEDTKICDSGQQYLEILKRHFGKWTDGDDGITFGKGVPKADIDAFNNAAQNLQEASQRQDTLMKQFRENQSKRK